METKDPVAVLVEQMESFLLRKLVLPMCETADAEVQLYHYTGFSGIRGIVESNSLWLTDVRYMNDASEHAYGCSIFDSEILRRTELTENPTQKRALRDLQFAFQADSFGARNVQVPFATSFCERHDELNQWRAYASGNDGVEIEFTTNDVHTEFVSPSTNIALELFRIEYDPEVQRDRANQLLDSYIEMARDWCAGTKTADQWRLRMAYFGPVFRNLISFLASTFKAQAFREEREWRIGALGKIVQWSGDFSFLHRRQTKYGEASYFAIEGSSGALPITAITLSPTFDGRLRGQLERMLCRSQYARVPIRTSQIPLRKPRTAQP